MYGAKLRSLIDMVAEATQEGNDKRKPVTSGGCDMVPTPPAEMWEQAETNTRQAKEAYKSFYDRRTALTPTVVEMGESVYRRNYERGWIRPYGPGPIQDSGLQAPKREDRRGKSQDNMVTSGRM